MNLIEFFLEAEDVVYREGYGEEIKNFDKLKPFDDQTLQDFFYEYVWVVLNAGMKEQVARKIYCYFIEEFEPKEIGHLGKRAAIERALNEAPLWFEELKKAEDKIAYLDTLPWIGPITKYHLARNLGIDTVKPDVHLKRLAGKYHYASPLEMCQDIQKVFPQTRLGVIDLILWRYCNLVGSDVYLAC